MTFAICKKVAIFSAIFGLGFVTFWICHRYLDSYNSSESVNNQENDSYLTIHCNKGRLGNQISSVAVLYGLAKLNHRKPAIQLCQANQLKNVFNIKLPVFIISSKDILTQHEIGYWFRDRDSRIPNDVNIVSGNPHPQSYTFFNIDRREVQKQFQFKPHLVKFAQSVLSTVRRSRETTLVGVHVRRNNYLRHLRLQKRKEVTVGYSSKAFQYFRERFSDLAFMVTSDDIEWCRKNLAHNKDVYLQENRVAAEFDFALLAHCNHSIITYGTFGFWSAYLAGGQTVYLSGGNMPGSWYDKTRPENKTFLPEWVGISEEIVKS